VHANQVLQALAVVTGAGFGALLRWAVGFFWLNSRFMGFPLSTLLVNSVGGLCMGMALVWFGRLPPTSAHAVLRLFITTGFLGGLTTFSAFSAESFALLEQGQFLRSAVHTLAHVVGALCCVWLGTQLMKLLTSS
jgi:fluoride exporter